MTDELPPARGDTKALRRTSPHLRSSMTDELPPSLGQPPTSYVGQVGGVALHVCNVRDTAR